MSVKSEIDKRLKELGDGYSFTVRKQTEGVWVAVIFSDRLGITATASGDSPLQAIERCHSNWREDWS